MPAQVRFVGLDRLLDKLDAKLLAKPLHDFFARVGITVQGRARENAPVDTGHLKNSIQYQVDGRDVPLWAKVGFIGAGDGTPLWFKARAMEYGTARQGDSEVSHKSSHFPPPAALDVWASRHGAGSGWNVAQGIFDAGGLRPRPFLRPALRESLSDIQGFIRRLGDDIRAAWEQR